MAARPSAPSKAQYLLLARVRRSIRALNSAIERGAESVGITLQQQSILLALAAYGGDQVPLADVREELEMDMATASVLLAKMTKRRLLVRGPGKDRRARELTLTRQGWSAFRRSLEFIRKEMRWAEHRGEFVALTRELGPYLRYYLNAPTRSSSPQARSRRAGSRRARSARRTGARRRAKQRSA